MFQLIFLVAVTVIALIDPVSRPGTLVVIAIVTLAIAGSRLVGYVKSRLIIYVKDRRTRMAGRLLQCAKDDLLTATLAEWNDNLQGWLRHNRLSPGSKSLSTIIRRHKDAAALAHDLCAGSLRRLLIRGGPGVGKTYFAMQLVDSLLAQARSDRAVPLLISMTGWDPKTETLQEWICRALTNRFPDLTNARRYGADAPYLLVSGGHLLPILDDLDTIPRHQRRRAIELIDEESRFVGDSQKFIAAFIDAIPPDERESVFRRVLGIAADKATLVIVCRSREYDESSPGPHGELPASRTYDVSPIPGAEYHRDLVTNEDRSWLASLANSPEGYAIHEIAWWRLPRLIPKHHIAVAMGITGFILGAGASRPPSSTTLLSPAAGWTVFVGMAGAALFATGSLAAVSIAVRGVPVRFDSRLLVGTLLGLGMGVVAGRAYGVGIGLAIGAASLVALVGILGVIGSIGYIVGLLQGLSGAVDHVLDLLFELTDFRLVRVMPRGPRDMLRADRFATWTIAAFIGLPITLSVANADKEPWDSRRLFSVAGLAALGLLVGLCSAAFVTKWPTFVVARTWLALQRRTPFRLMKYLNEANSRGILVQDGYTYRFRDSRIEESVCALVSK